MKRENIELTKDVTEALDKMDFDNTQGRNREYVKDLQAISKFIYVHLFSHLYIWEFEVLCNLNQLSILNPWFLWSFTHK